MLVERVKRKKQKEELIEMEIRQPSQGVLMEDEDVSAHQFSLREQSVQADSEERMNEVPNIDDEFERGSVKSKSFPKTIEPTVTSPAKRASTFKRQSTLFSEAKEKSEIGIQTIHVQESRWSPKRSVTWDA